MSRQEPVVVTRRGGMRRSRLLLVVSFVVISSLLAWACGGGGEEKPSGPTAPAATSPAGETPAAGKTAEAGAGGGEFGDLIGKFNQATFKVTYQLSGDGANATQGSMTWYKKGDNLRMDMTDEAGGQQTSAIFIEGPDKSYFCSNGPEVGGGSSCFAVPAGQGTGVSDIAAGLENTLTDPNVDIVSTSSRKIAGEDAKCYTIRSPDVEGESEICLSNEGVPLFTKETVEGVETTMEATDFSRDVSDSDFEPPYPVTEELPSIPEGQ
jgi:hypothetical protein